MTRRFAMAMAALLLGMSAATAQQADRVTSTAIVNQWYVVHLAGHGDNVLFDSVNDLLADDAKIELVSMDIVQTRDEYMDALDNWPDAIEGGTIAHIVTAADSAGATARVCYRFSGSEMLAEEIFTIASGKITGLVSTTLADDCAGF